MIKSMELTNVAQDSEQRRRDALERRIGGGIRAILESNALTEHGTYDKIIDAVASALAPRRDCTNKRFRERLLEREGWSPRCWICGLPIPMDAEPDSHEAFSVDHVKPRSEGGARLGFDNLRPAHRFCNVIRSTNPRNKTKERYRKFLESLQRRFESCPAA
jgi:5-methylcytosine-specific restriction endonuclease McrA